MTEDRPLLRLYLFSLSQFKVRPRKRQIPQYRIQYFVVFCQYLSDSLLPGIGVPFSSFQSMCVGEWRHTNAINCTRYLPDTCLPVIVRPGIALEIGDR